MKKATAIIISLVSLFFLIKSGPVLAQASPATEVFDQLDAATGNNGANFGSYTDPRELAAKIIKTALGVVGIIFVGLAIYAGFLWMTAAGNDEQVGTARKLLTNAAIGLGVILVAYSLTIFVFNSLIRSTTQMNIDNQNSDFCRQNPDDQRCAM